ncbi:MAG: UbiA family prenyltransferase [Rhodobacteraceae bacterium]|nr:UbiA family prenyltransferase [Paracoccaceae bacterium]
MTSDSFSTAALEAAQGAEPFAELIETLPEVIAVELEGGLIHGTLRDERVWAQLSLKWLPAGEDELEPDGRRRDALTPQGLAYRETALEFIREAARLDRRVCLSCDEREARLAQEIADHIPQLEGIWPHSFSTDGQTYALVGPQSPYHPLADDAAAIVTLDLPDRARAAFAGRPIPAHVVGAPNAPGPAFWAALRPHQWAKNLLVFLPMMAGQVWTLPSFAHSALAFAAFCLVASSVYALNDLLDLASDRAHPRKQERPFASGALPLSWGRPMAVGLLLAGMAIALVTEPLFALVLAGYYLLTAAYSFYFKRKTILDICTLAGLYTIRIVAGSVATSIYLSVWLLALSIFLFLALAAIKRQAELVDALGRGEQQPAGRGYRAEDLPLISQMAISSSYVAVLVLALYLNTPSVQELYATPALLWGICLILLYWLSRAVMKTHRGEMHDDPIIFAFKDRVSLVCVLAAAVLAVLAANF